MKHVRVDGSYWLAGERSAVAFDGRVRVMGGSVEGDIRSVRGLTGGILAHAAGRGHEAMSHFDDALALCRNAGYRSELAWTCRDYARLLLETKGLAGGERADSLLEEAAAISSELGMPPLASLVASLRERHARLPERAIPLPPAEENVFRLDGEYWTVAYGGKAVRMKDVKGLRDIACLLGAAGREVHVADLIAGSRDSAFDLILLDPYEGPNSATQAADDPFYGPSALARIHRALAPRGVVGIWSEDADPPFARRLAAARFNVTKHSLRSGASRHVVYLGLRR